MSHGCGKNPYIRAPSGHEFGFFTQPSKLLSLLLVQSTIFISLSTFKGQSVLRDNDPPYRVLIRVLVSQYKREAVVIRIKGYLLQVLPYESPIVTLTSCFLQSNIAKTQIDDYFGQCLGGMTHGSFWSSYLLEKQLKTLGPLREYLSLSEAILVSWDHLTTFYYRNNVFGVRYLIRQVSYKEDIFYAPIRKYDSNGNQ